MLLILLLIHIFLISIVYNHHSIRCLWILFFLIIFLGANTSNWNIADSGNVTKSNSISNENWNSAQIDQNVVHQTLEAARKISKHVSLTLKS